MYSCGKHNVLSKRERLPALQFQSVFNNFNLYIMYLLTYVNVLMLENIMHSSKCHLWSLCIIYSLIHNVPICVKWIQDVHLMEAEHTVHINTIMYPYLHSAWWYFIIKMNESCFRPWFDNVRLCWTGATWANERNIVLILPKVQDRLLDKLTCSPV